MRLWLLFPLCIAAIGALFVAFAYLPNALKPSGLRQACTESAADGTLRDIGQGLCRE